MFERFKKPNFNKQIESFQKEKLSRLERATEKGRMFLKRVRQISTILALAGLTNYEISHTNSIDKKFEDGKEVFRHSDKETDHILNYIGGIDSLSHEEKFELFKSECQFRTKMDYPIPENFGIMTEDEVISFFYFLEKKPDHSKGESDKDAYEKYKKATHTFIDNEFPTKYEYNEKLYNLLWETEEECGAPKVRWTYGKDRNLRTAGNASIAHYSELNNICFIEPYDSHSVAATGNKDNQLSTLISEWSHSKQFGDNYISSGLESLKDGIRVARDIFNNTHDYVESIKKEYQIKGSIEHEAHEIIEPYLTKKFEGMNLKKVDDKGSKK